MSFQCTTKKIMFLIICLFSAFLIMRSFFYIYNYYSAPLYWDQWEFVRDISERHTDVFSLRYLFQGHNEHVIATTKIFFLLDYLFFDLKNGPLITLISFLAFVVAVFLSLLVFSRAVKGSQFFLLVCILFAAAVSLAQYQNLFWGFQPQFYLVSLTAIWTLLAALKMVESDTSAKRMFWFLMLCIATFLCIFSMGNGIAIPISVALFLVFIRWRRWSMIVVYFVVSALWVCVDLYLTRHAMPVGNLSQRTPLNILFFFFTMIGSSLSRNIQTAFAIGIGVFVLYGVTFIKLIAVPWFKREDIDRGVAALFALGSFFFAAAAAAAWTRSPLGQGAALASRYSTPMLLLLMIWFCIWFRGAATRENTKSLFATAILTAMVIVAAASTLREKNAASVFKAQTRAAYFVLSQVEPDDQLLKLYPDAKAVRSAIDWLRRNQLNIFARNGGISVPDASELLSVQDLDDSRLCANYAIDQIAETSSGQLQLTGWVTDAQKQTPMWVLAFDERGKLLGFTKPLENRSDVTAVVGAEPGFHGFVLPVNMSSSNRREIQLRIISKMPGASCKITTVKTAG